MGVRGLKSLLERENQTRPIDIGDEVHKWKRHNTNKKPVIVIDFLSLTNGVAKKEDDAICAGRHQITMNQWKRLLDALKTTQCSLVFFSDLNIQGDKIEEWLNRRNDEFKIHTKLYDSINDGKTLPALLNESRDRKALTSTFYGMAVIARSYGELYFSIKYECDLEAAQYATKHNAIAVLTNDTDFLIFEGTWKLWSPQDICVTQSNRVKTIEYNRNGLANIFSLALHQLPLFATLMGNDFTHSHYHALSDFSKTMGPLKYRAHNIARYVRKVGTYHLSDDDIHRIVQHVFGYECGIEIDELVRKSLDSYKLDFPPAIVDNPIEVKLLHTNMYRPYMGNISPIHGITLPFYDMRGSPPNASLSKLLINWVKRRKGIVMPRNHTFTLLAKKEINEEFLAHRESVTYPDFSVPPLDQLYTDSRATGDGDDDDDQWKEIRWTIFTWIMSFTNEVTTTINQLPKKFRLISATLYTLVKNGLLSVEVADGILYTENMVYENKIKDVRYPVVMVAGYIRAAHIYNITFSSVRQNFAISGLLPFVQENLQFDGVYFQKLMEQRVIMNAMERESFLDSIQKYRIYAQCAG